MTPIVERLAPQTLLGRIFLLLAACVALFTVAALAFTYTSHTEHAIEGAEDTLEVLADSVQPAVSDSAVIGDYDTIQRTLDRLALAPILASARFVDALGTVLEARNSMATESEVPALFIQQVERRVNRVSREITAGGKVYGRLELRYRSDNVAGEIWLITRAYLLFALILLVPMLYIARIQLKRMVANLAEAAEFATGLKAHRGTTLHLPGAASELRSIQDALNDVSQELSHQHQRLADSEARKSAILSAGLDSFITLDEAGLVVDFNRAAETTFGYSAEEARGRLMSELLIPPNLREAHEKGMAHWRATGEGPVLHQRIEITAMRRSGEIFPVELTVVPFSSGRHNFFAGFIRDITQRKQLEADREQVTLLLRDSVRELEYQKFALDQHAIVSIADADGFITYANDKFSEISGFNRKELIGSTHRIVKSGAQPAAFYDNLWQTITAGKTFHGEIVNRNKSGELYWVAATIVPWTDETGTPYQYVSIYTDITAQKKSEQALAEARLREIRTGYDIQRTLLFGGNADDIRGAQIATYTEASQGIDGDFFSITCLRDDCFEVLAGDVMGKGVPAALVGAAIKSSYHMALAELLAKHTDGTLPAPADIVNTMHRNLTRRLVDLDSFATLVLYRVDRSDGSLTYVNAGHTSGLLVRHGGSIEEIEGENTPIGVLADEVYVQIRTGFAAGDSLLVYSDGIIEASKTGRDLYGPTRLHALLRAGIATDLPPSAMLQALRQDVRHFVGHDQLTDDQTAVMLSLQPLRRGVRGTLSQRQNPCVLVLPWKVEALEKLRESLLDHTDLMSPDAVDALVLGAFEAATNILRHVSPYFGDATLACRINRKPDALVIDLIYPGPSFTPPEDTEPDFSGEAEGGFGLYIIENMVDEVEYSCLVRGVSQIRLVKYRDSVPAQ